MKAPKPSATHVETQARDAQLALERLRRMAKDAADGRDAALQDAHGMCVYFTKLASSKADFREMIFPGEPPQRFDDHDLPGTLCEFLNDARYASSIKKRWPSVLRKAHTVLVGAKKQGEELGEKIGKVADEFKAKLAGAAEALVAAPMRIRPPQSLFLRLLASCRQQRDGVARLGRHPHGPFGNVRERQ